MTYTAKINAPFQVKTLSYDATRPYAVVATFRSFNTVVGRYETMAKAMRRAYDMNIRVADQFEVTR